MYDDKGRFQSVDDAEDWNEEVSEASRYRKLYETFKKEGDRSRSFALALSSVERSMLELVAYHKNLNQSQRLRLLLYDAYNRIVEEERGEDF